MKINLPIQHIVPELTGANSFEVIDELVNHLVVVGSVLPENKMEIASALRQRERSMSTGIGFGVALPHALTHLVEDVIIAFGRSRTGIGFDALDRQPVRLVAMMVVPAGERERSLRTLAAVSRLLHKEAVRSALELAPDAAAIADILNARMPISTDAQFQEARSGVDYT